MPQSGLGKGGYNLLHMGFISPMRILFFFIVINDTTFFVYNIDAIEIT